MWYLSTDYFVRNLFSVMFLRLVACHDLECVRYKSCSTIVPQVPESIKSVSRRSYILTGYSLDRHV